MKVHHAFRSNNRPKKKQTGFFQDEFEEKKKNQSLLTQGFLSLLYKM